MLDRKERGRGLKNFEEEDRRCFSFKITCIFKIREKISKIPSIKSKREETKKKGKDNF